MWSIKFGWIFVIFVYMMELLCLHTCFKCPISRSWSHLFSKCSCNFWAERTQEGSCAGFWYKFGIRIVGEKVGRACFREHLSPTTLHNKNHIISEYTMSTSAYFEIKTAIHLVFFCTINICQNIRHFLFFSSNGEFRCEWRFKICRSSVEFN